VTGAGATGHQFPLQSMAKLEHGQASFLEGPAAAKLAFRASSEIMMKMVWRMYASARKNFDRVRTIAENPSWSAEIQRAVAESQASRRTPPPGQDTLSAPDPTPPTSTTPTLTPTTP
jgi:hypothetical protein